MLPAYSNFEQVYHKSNTSTENAIESFQIAQSGWYVLRGLAYTQGSAGNVFATGITIADIPILCFSAEKTLGNGWGNPQFSGMCYLPSNINVDITTRYGSTYLYKVT